MSTFDPAFEELPDRIPIFPLTGVLLLPRGELPLNIFEPRYLNMTLDAMAGSRMIGMIQPTEHEGSQPTPPVYRTGCAGRIVRYEETADGRLLIKLKGVCRFDVTRELPITRGYRPVTPDWSPYRSDMRCGCESAIDRQRLVGSLKPFFAQHGLTADWTAIETTPDERLITCLSMICPFEASEKQALLEAPTLQARAKVLTALIEMSVLGCTPGNAGRQ
jgi:uncharacterized protein